MSELQKFIASRTPTGWTTKPLWTLFRRRKLTGHADEELLSVYRDYGVIPKSSRDDNFNKESDDLSGYQLVTEGALVTNKMKAWQGSIAVSRFRGIVSPAYYVYEPLSDEHDQFLHYLLRSDPYIALYRRISKGVRVNQWDLEHEALRNVPVMLPDKETQKAIADFLDHETARIDQLIEKKQRLVEVAREKFGFFAEALISGRRHADAVATRGRSGAIHFLPLGWTETRLRFGIRRIEQGWSPQCEDRLVEGDDWGVLKLGAITTGIFREESHKALPSTLSPIPSYAIRVGDVLIARASGSPALVGKACLINKVSRNLMISDKHYRVELDTHIFDPSFFVHFLNSPLSRVQIENRLSSAEGMARNIGQEVIKSIWLSMPPRDEQAAIARLIDKFFRQTSTLTDRVTYSIDRLRELRAALITAAVTGQINVETWGKQEKTDHRLDQIEAEMSVREARA